MVGELSAGVASSSDYLRDQTALMGCMRATSTSSGGGAVGAETASRRYDCHV